MAWIESHQSLRDHPKTRKLSRILGVSLPATIGHLQCMWWWALDYAEDGNLSRFDWDDIEMGAEWDGLPDAFVDGLIRVGFLDFTDPDGNDLTIHDWDDYAGKLIERRKANAERMRKARAERDAGTSEPRAAHVQRTTDARAERPNRTNQTKPTVPNQPEGGTDAPAAPPTAKESTKRASRIPDGFAITDDLRKWALERGMAALDIERRTETFVNYWAAESGAKASKLDWFAAWKVWISRDFPDTVPRNGALTVHAGGRTGPGSYGRRVGSDGLTDDERGWRENPGHKGWSADELARMGMADDLNQRSGT
ncbi:MAG: hypothetical protein M3440_13525 [Chloroflexota bacterium]|nr:hypothetical protein [Chloroflexota bacterium]